MRNPERTVLLEGLHHHVLTVLDNWRVVTWCRVTYHGVWVLDEPAQVVTCLECMAGEPFREVQDRQPRFIDPSYVLTPADKLK